MVDLPDPQHSRAVIIGTSRYQSLPSLHPAVHNNVVDLAAALRDQNIWGLPSPHCGVIEDPDSPEEMLDLSVQAAAEATDTLLVYYAGHGLIDSQRGELHLSLRRSNPERIYTAVAYDHIREVVLSSRARRKLVILDCCYSGRALGQMGGRVNTIADEASAEGTYIIAAAAENKPALALPDETYTAFTSELLDVFINGLPDRDDTLSLDVIYNHILAEMRRKMRPLPQKRDRNTAGCLRFIRNRQARRSQSLAIPESRPFAPPSDGDAAPFYPTEESHAFNAKLRGLDVDIDSQIRSLLAENQIPPRPARSTTPSVTESVDREIDAHIRELFKEDKAGPR